VAPADGVFQRDATRATGSPDGGGDRVVLQGSGSDLIRSTRHNGQDAILDQPANAVMVTLLNSHH
jgi:hypothetical protein